MDRIWGPRPVHLAVVGILEKKNALTDIDLLHDIKDNFGEISLRELNRVLMKLEISGIIRVSRLMKGKRRVELVAASS
jgi:Fe2+ or Zn2+ uptake regulation protein